MRSGPRASLKVATPGRVFMPGRERQLDREGRAEALPPALGADGPPVEFRQVTHERQPEAEAPVPPRGRAVTLAEAVEDVRQEVRADALARVAHLDLGQRPRVNEVDLDAPPLVGKLDGVREEVRD